MVYTKHKRIQAERSLKNGIKYIINDSKTTLDYHVDNDPPYPTQLTPDGEIVTQLVSGHMVMDLAGAGSEFLQVKQMANLQKGRPRDYHLQKEDMVLAHHLIQSFSPDDALTPEEIHELGRQTVLELTGGNHAFVIATHIDQDHIHNHIYFNSTNEVTLNQFRWQKGTKRNFEKISDRLADIAGAKVIDRQTKFFNHTQYQAYQKQNVFKNEIKSRLEFLLKHSTSLEDFKLKAQQLDLAVDFSGKYATYRLLDQPQERNRRDDKLSKKGRYSLESISKRVGLNQVVYPLQLIKEAYDKQQAEEEQDFEMRLVIEPWQVDQVTKTGIYVEVDYGLRNQGTIKIPHRCVDQLEDGRYELFVKRTDFFYFINPDQADKNKFVRGDTLLKQLSYHNGEYILNRNPNISKLDQLLKEFDYLSKHNVTDSQQFQELGKSYLEQLDQVEQVLEKIDLAIAKHHKVIASLEAYQLEGGTNRLLAKENLEAMGVSPQLSPDVVKKEITELTVERNALRDKFDHLTKGLKEYKEVKDNSYIRSSKKEREEEREK
ncbi:relaxase/mobilization nuclease domain-containing protein [Streptococcus suis]|nr:relaxase/mobilization nuclease domain-containing protein [Streptococcus suis]